MQNFFDNSLFFLFLNRDEALHHHSYIQSYFDSKKDLSKRVSEVKETYNIAVQNA